MSRTSADLDSEARTRSSETHGPPTDGRRRVEIEAVKPELDAGTHAVKRVLGDTVTISADLIADGHDLLAGEVLVRRPARRAQPDPREPAAHLTEVEFAAPLERLADGSY